MRRPCLALSCVFALASVAACDSDESSTTGADGTDTSSASSGPSTTGTSTGTTSNTTSTTTSMTTSSTSGTSTTSTTGDPSGSTGVDVTCSTQCAPLPPAGWLGPGVIDTQTGISDTGGCESTAPFVTPEFLAYDGVSAPDATCECDCGAAQGVQCAGSAIGRQRTVVAGIGSFGCADPTLGSFGVATGQDEDLANTSDRTAWALLVGFDDPTTGGSCTPEFSTELDPPAGSTIRGCGRTLVGDDGCEPAEYCRVDPPPDLTLCIWQDGDHDRPAGSSFTDKTLYGQTLADERSCSACSCGDPTGTCTDARVRFVTTNTSVFYESAVPNGCFTFVPQNQTQLDFATYVPGNLISASCSPQGGEPMGDITAQDPVTVCCEAG